jgi:EAL domain-containing protein (putative c-di-GMP-specific phosphodiesterase class I)
MGIKSEVLENIIEQKDIEVHYQPIVSIRKKTVIGLEGLSRGVFENELIDPLTLFKKASKEKLNVQLDRICREKVAEGFKDIYKKNKDLLLFMNIDISTMTNETVGSGFLINLVQECQIRPESVVLEFVESKVSDVEALKRFVDSYRSYGFLIALDDVGSGHSNLDRIAIAQPDIVKIDGVIVRDIHLDYYKQEVFKSLVSLSKNLGATVAAEGIENEEEALKVMELGADMLQGFYFSKAQPISSGILKNSNYSIKKISNNYSDYMTGKVNDEKNKLVEYEIVIKEVLHKLSLVEEKRFDFTLLDIVNNYRIFECLYILDSRGIQVSDSATTYNHFLKHKSLIFHSSKKGENHSFKKYYYFLKIMKLSKYMTEPYISVATGSLCVTMSCIFKNIENKKYILCLDLNPDSIYI